MIAGLILSFSAFAETTIKEKMPDSNSDSSVLIERKVNPKIHNDYEVVSEEQEIAGDPTAGTKEAYQAWKTACADWKKEVKENNAGNQIITLSCGTAAMIKDETGSGVYTYRSNGKSKIRVRLKEK